MRVLIIEDDPGLCEIYKLAFEQEGCEVVIKNDGLNAIAELTIIQPDLVILDLMIPELNGFEFLEAVTNNTSESLKVIVASNLSGESDIKRAIDLGAIGYLRKVDYTGKELVQEALTIYRKSLL